MLAWTTRSWLHSFETDTDTAVFLLFYLFWSSISTLPLLSVSQQEVEDMEEREGHVVHCGVASQSSWQPHTPSSLELSCCHCDPLPLMIWTWLIKKNCPRSSISFFWNPADGREDWNRWECCWSSTGALLGNTGMPVQQITVVPTGETTSKSTSHTKDKNEVRLWPRSSVVRPQQFLWALFCFYFLWSKFKIKEKWVRFLENMLVLSEGGNLWSVPDFDV